MAFGQELPKEQIQKILDPIQSAIKAAGLLGENLIVEKFILHKENVQRLKKHLKYLNEVSNWRYADGGHVSMMGTILAAESEAPYISMQIKALEKDAIKYIDSIKNKLHTI